MEKPPTNFQSLGSPISLQQYSMHAIGHAASSTPNLISAVGDCQCHQPSDISSPVSQTSTNSSWLVETSTARCILCQITCTKSQILHHNRSWTLPGPHRPADPITHLSFLSFASTLVPSPNSISHSHLSVHLQSLLLLIARSTAVPMLHRSLTAHSLLSSGFHQPILLRPLSGPPSATAAALQMQLPTNFSLQLLLQHLGDQHRVPVIDVATQEAAAAVPLGQWCSYWSSSDRGSQRLLNVLSLSLAGTAMQQQVIIRCEV